MDLKAEAVKARRSTIVSSLIVAAVAAFVLSVPADAQQSTAGPEEVLPAPQPKASPPRSAAKKSAEPEPVAAPAPAPAAGCAYLGKRVVQSLLRDDAVTAGDFERVYRTFSCSGEHLRTAFDCTVSAPLPANANEVSGRVDACWADPKYDAKQAAVPTVAPPAKGDAKGDGKGEAKSEGKGDSKGEAKSEGKSEGKSDSKGEPRQSGKASSQGTPNYTNQTPAPKGQ